MRAGLWGGLAATVAGILLISWWPQPVDREVLRALEQVLPGIRTSVVDSPAYGPSEVIANVALYVPLGALVGALAWGTARPSNARSRVVLVALGAGLLLSVIAESGQALWLPERYPTGWDVLANTVGATLGGLLVVLGGRLRAR